MQQVTPLSQSGQRCLRGPIGFPEWVSFFQKWREIRRWASKHYVISKPVMSCNCVSSTVICNGMIPLHVKNSCFTDRAIPSGVVDRDTHPVLRTNSKLLWWNMKPTSWIGGRQPSSSTFIRQGEKSGGFSFTC